MDDEWYLAVLSEFSLDRSATVKVESDQVQVRLGDLSGCLWRSTVSPEEQALLVDWEESLRPHDITAVRLRTRGGAPWVRVDDRTIALLTAWQGSDLPRLGTADELAPIAGFLGRFRRLSADVDLPAPRDPGLSWGESWQERAGRLRLFAKLAAARLSPTRFDLAFLEQANYFQRQADRATVELAQALQGMDIGVALNEINQRRLYRGRQGLAAKSLLGLAAEAPIRDLYRLLARTLPKLEWALPPAAAVLAAYSAEWPPRPGELAVLQAALRFPNDHYRLAHHYFLNHKTWPLRTFLRKQDEIWQREPARNRLVEEIPLLLP